MREEVTAGERVPEAELCAECAQPFPGLGVALVARHDLDKPVVVGVAGEAGHAICGDLVLEVDVRDGRPHVVRVEALRARDVLELDAHLVGDIYECAFVGLPRRVEDAPVVV